jgi:hypothetical protein
LGVLGRVLDTWVGENVIDYQHPSSHVFRDAFLSVHGSLVKEILAQVMASRHVKVLGFRVEQADQAALHTRNLRNFYDNQFKDFTDIEACADGAADFPKAS